MVDVASLAMEPGSRVELRDVLLVADGDKISVGRPTVADALVVAEVVEHGRGPKVINFKFKAKTRYRRKRGHRQGFTRLEVQEIRIGGEAAPAQATRGRRRAAATEAAVETPAVEAEAPAEAKTPARATRGRRRTAATETAPEAPVEVPAVEAEAPAEAKTPAHRRRRPPEPSSEG